MSAAEKERQQEAHIHREQRETEQSSHAEHGGQPLRAQQGGKPYTQSKEGSPYTQSKEGSPCADLDIRQLGLGVVGHFFLRLSQVVSESVFLYV
jgi:hypothetical protein